MQPALKTGQSRWKKWLRRTLAWIVAVALIAWVGIRFVPVPEALLRKPPESLELTDRNGHLLRETRVAERFQREVPLAAIPESMRRAMFAAEDKRFLAHGGVDWLATGRALWDGARVGRINSGASTISQQLIKVSVPRPRTLRTKVIEMATALRLEQIWSKDEILAAYLNRIDFGSLNFGIASAANYYFGKPLSDLSQAEAALLAGLPLNPSRLNPHTNPAGAKRRQTTVLRRMRESGWLSEEQFQQALSEPLRYQPPQRTFLAPHFVDLVLQDVADSSEKPSDDDRRPRLHGKVATTLDLDLNRFIEGTLTDKLAKLRDHNVHDGAVVVLDNRSREVLGLVGSGDYFAPGTGEVNGATVPRSAGSTIKPITYLLAFERGDTPATILPDIPTEFPTDSGPYRPENYARHCQGPVSMREALACSLNIPAVRLLQSLGGPLPLQRRLHAWGITTLPKEPREYGLGLTIGNAEVRLIELANLFATLARNGEFRPVRIIPGLDHIAHEIPRPSVPEIKPELFWLLADILSDNAARQPQFGGASPLRFDFPVACKTGTSTDFRDNWAVGYTPEFTVAVWIGNFDGTPMVNVSGVSGAGPVLHDVIEQMHSRFGSTWFPRPSGITERTVHPITGHMVAKSQPGAVTEKFHQLPPQESPADYDAAGRVLLGSEFAPWAASVDNHLRDRIAIRADGNIRITSPVSGSTFIVDPDIPSTTLVPVAATIDGVEWESRTLQFRNQSGKTYAVAIEGEHQITVRDPASGKTAATTIKIRGL